MVILLAKKDIEEISERHYNFLDLVAEIEEGIAKSDPPSFVSLKGKPKDMLMDKESHAALFEKPKKGGDDEDVLL